MFEWGYQIRVMASHFKLKYDQYSALIDKMSDGEQQLPKQVLAACVTHHPVELTRVYKVMTTTFQTMGPIMTRQSPSPSPTRRSDAPEKKNPFLHFREEEPALLAITEHTADERVSESNRGSQRHAQRSDQPHGSAIVRDLLPRVVPAPQDSKPV